MPKNRKTNKPKGLFAVRYKESGVYCSTQLWVLARTLAAATEKARKFLRKTKVYRPTISDVVAHGTIDVF